MAYKPPKYVLSSAAALAIASASPANAQTLAAVDDGEWMSVAGTVESVSGDMFMLDYGPRSIAVEMDDYDWFDENPVLLGDRVVVTGRMDDDFFQSRRIEASSVYVDSAHTLFFASAADEEAVIPAGEMDIVSSSGIRLTGRVQDIDGENLTLDTGLLDYTIDTGTLPYDPFDEDGVQQIAVGDRVSVRGRFDDSDLFDHREIDAVFVTELSG